jgi:N-hydroxyarylamine O-acetyltransferase
MDRAELADAYLRALGLDREEPSADYLERITMRHVDRIPFSSIGPRLGDALPLDLESLHDRLIVRRRGGYCFEQNRFAHEMLDELGFDVRRYLARVVYGGDPAPPLTHRVTIADIAGEQFVVDVGFGGIGPLAPIPLRGPAPEPTWRAFRVTWPTPTRFQVEAERHGAFIPLYTVDLVDYTEADCELGHFYSHRHPEALFVNHLVVMRTAVGEVRSLSDRSYRVLRPSGDVREDIASSERLHEVLTQEFDLSVTPEEARRLFAG